MVVSFLKILEEAFVRLLPSGEHLVAALSKAAIFSMISTIAIKGIIGLAFVRVKAPQVQALVQGKLSMLTFAADRPDCKTDVFFNTFSLLFPAIGYQWDIWWLDPLGAGLLSLFIVYDWCETCFGNVIRLSGSSVDDRLLQKIIFVAYRFESLVLGIKNVVAYHAGDGIWVEIDILLDPQEKLLRAHDIAETLQYCLEGLAEVDRAFVSVDCRSFSLNAVADSFRYLPRAKRT
jgi:divalent metal cation (Fe/Co/Zn/Cd) transporter